MFAVPLSRKTVIISSFVSSVGERNTSITLKCTLKASITAEVNRRPLRLPDESPCGLVTDQLCALECVDEHGCTARIYNPSNYGPQLLAYERETVASSQLNCIITASCSGLVLEICLWMLLSRPIGLYCPLPLSKVGLF